MIVCSVGSAAVSVRIVWAGCFSELQATLSSKWSMLKSSGSRLSCSAWNSQSAFVTIQLMTSKASVALWRTSPKQNAVKEIINSQEWIYFWHAVSRCYPVWCSEAYGLWDVVAAADGSSEGLWVDDHELSLLLHQTMHPQPFPSQLLQRHLCEK